jgi:hypothetical protein
MPHPEHKRIPSWAERERSGDLFWIGQNLHVFWPIAQAGYDELGRGANVVGITSRPTGQGHPFGYFRQEVLEEHGDCAASRSEAEWIDTRRMVAQYDPAWELVTVLLKTHDRTSTYRVGVLPPLTTEQSS